MTVLYLTDFYDTTGRSGTYHSICNQHCCQGSLRKGPDLLGYGFFDTITIGFSEPTDRTGFELNSRIPQTTINLMLSFTHKMGSIIRVETKWVTDSKIILTVEGTVGATGTKIPSRSKSTKTQVWEGKR